MPSEAQKGRVFPITLFYFLPLTRASHGAKNRRKTSSLVVSLLSNCHEQYASEAADLPGRAGLLSRQGYCQATPHHPGGENESVFTSFLFLGAASYRQAPLPPRLNCFIWFLAARLRSVRSARRLLPSLLIYWKRGAEPTSFAGLLAYPMAGNFSAQLAGLDAFLAGFVKQRVNFGLKIFLLILQRAHLHLDGFALMAFVELEAAGGRRWLALTEVL
jgi:hypothetical protein